MAGDAPHLSNGFPRRTIDTSNPVLTVCIDCIPRGLLYAPGGEDVSRYRNGREKFPAGEMSGGCKCPSPVRTSVQSTVVKSVL